jgi:hypothetical protein
MGKQASQPSESRSTPRLKLPAMYTLVRVRPVGEERYRWTGHIYDVSESGMRFELDQPIEAGTRVEVRAMLPGSSHITFNAAGHIVRLHDDCDERGPVRMGMVFERFTRQGDQLRLSDYLSGAGLKAA